MKSKKKLSLKKMTVSQLNSISGGNNDLIAITARETNPILCNYNKTNPVVCHTTVRQTLFVC